MRENHIIVNKTARYYTAGELNGQTREVWFVLHGHKDTAQNFLSSFEPMMNERTFVIAPEALNRFYVSGHSGAVGASWMTKEDRLNEIKDYIHYLEDLYEYFELEKFSLSITALGFSQGASTVSRWVNASEHRIDNVIIYAGEVGAEILPLHSTSQLKRTKNYFVCGTSDPFISTAALDKMRDAYKELNFTEVLFDGKHEMKVELIKGLAL